MADDNIVLSAKLSDEELKKSIDSALGEAKTKFTTFSNDIAQTLRSLEVLSASVGKNIGNNLGSKLNPNLKTTTSSSTMSSTTGSSVNVNELNSVNRLLKERARLIDAAAQKNAQVNAAWNQYERRQQQGIKTTEQVLNERYRKEQSEISRTNQLKAKQSANAWDKKEKSDINQKLQSEKRLTREIEAQNSALARQKSLSSSYMPKTFSGINSMNENTLNGIIAKQKALSSYRGTLGTNSSELKKVNKEYQRLGALQTQIMTSGVKLEKSNKTLAASFANLGKRVIFYAGLGALTGFVSRLISIRGQYELLEISMGAIIGDMYEGSKIFKDIQSNALKSPLTVIELSTAAKQLLAYNFSANEVVETTRRLADISTALGVPLERLSYNLGQIKAKAVLTARDSRDFANAGLAIVPKLTEMYTKLEGRVVSTGEVYNRMSKKMVSYGDVMKVINGLTDEGGMFFNFQAKQAQTLKGQISILTDAYNLMLNEIGKSDQSTISGGISMLRTLFNNWKLIVNIVDQLVVTYGVYKAATILISLANTKFATSTSWLSTAIKEKVGTTLGDVAAMTLAEAHTMGLTTKEYILAKATMFAQTALLGLKSVLMGLGIGLIVAGITLLIAKFMTAHQEAEEFKNSLQEAISGGIREADKLVSNFDRLISKLNGAAVGSKDFKQAMSTLNATYGEYLPNVLTEINYTSELAKNYNNVVDAIYNKTKAQSLDKGLQVIEERYGKNQDNAIASIIKDLTSRGMSKEQSSDIIKLYQQSLKGGFTDMNDAWSKFSNTIDKYFNKDTEKRLKYSSISYEQYNTDIGISVGKLVENIKKQQDAEKDLMSVSDIRFNKATYNSESERKGIESINTKYEKLADTESNQINKLKETEKLYQRIGNAFQANKIKKQIDELTKKNADWYDAVKKVAEESKSFEFAPTEGEQFFDYVDRLKSSYKSLSKEQKMISAGANVDKLTKDYTEAQLKAAQKIGKILNIDLSSDNKKKKAPEQAAIREEISLINQLNSSYTTLTKNGLSSKDAVAQLTEEFGKSVSNINKVLSKSGIKGFKVSDFAGKDQSSILSLLQTQRDQMFAKKLEVKDLDVQIQKIRVSAKTYDITQITEGLDKSLSDIKDQYDIGKTASNNNGLSTLFAKMFGMDIKDLPKTASEATKLMQDATDKAIEQYNATNKTNLGNLDIITSDVKKWAKSYGIDVNSTFIKSILNVQKESRSDLESEFKAVESRMDKYLSDSGSYAYKLEQIEKDKATALSELNSVYYSDELKKSQAYQDKLEAINKTARKNTATAAWDNYKNSDLYVKMFENIKSVSTPTLENMHEKLLNIGESLKGLDPLILKTITEQAQKINDELSARNPFESMKKSLDEYIQSSKDIIKIQDKISDLDKDGKKGSKEYAAAENALVDAQNKRSKAAFNLSTTFASTKSTVGELTSSLKKLGDTLGDSVGKGMEQIADMVNITMSGIEGIVKLVSISANAMQSTATVAATAIATLEKASVILAVISAAIQLAQKISSLFSNSDTEYEKYAAKVKEVNDLTDAVNEYKIAVLKATQAERDWFGNDSLTSLKDAKDKQLEVSKNYFEKLHEQQEIYKNKSGGGWWTNMWNGILKGYDKILGTSTFGKKYKEGTTEAINNLRIETRKKKSGWLGTGIGGRSQKTEDLQSWIDSKPEFGGAKLFDAAGFINKELAQIVIDKYGNKLVGESKETLEQLIELKKSYDEYITQLKEYVSSLYEPLIQNFTDSLWDWLQEGKDALDSFKDYASDTFKDIVSDMMKTIMLKTIFKGYEDDISALYEKYSSGALTEESLSKAIAERTALLMNNYQTQLPALEQTMTVITDAFKKAGIDLTKSSKASSALSALQQGISSVSETTAGAIEGYMNNISQQGYARNTLLQLIASNGEIQISNGSQILLQLRESYQISQSMFGMLEGWGADNGRSVRVTLIDQ